MKKFGLALLFLFGWIVTGWAQNTPPIVVSACGTQSLTPGNAARTYIDATGNLCSSTSGGGGGGGPATIANGADVAEGNTADAAWSGSGAGTLVAIAKATYAAILNGAGATGATVPADAIYFGLNSSGNLVGAPGDATNGVFAQIKTWAGGTLGAMSNYGTSPGAVLVPGFNAFCTNCAGSTTPPAGFTPNGNYASLAVTGTTGNVALPAGTSVAVANTGSQTAFVNFGTSGAVTATTSNVPVAGGQTIAFTVGSNTFIAGITSSLTTNLTLIGGVGAYSGTGGSVTLNAPANDVSAGPQNFTGAGNLVVSSQGSGSVGLIISGTFTGAAYTLQGSVDGTNYAAIPFANNSIGGTTFIAQPSGTTVGTYVAAAAGYKSVRLNVTAVSTGTLVASLNASAGSAQRPTGTQGDNSNINGINGGALDPCFATVKMNVPIATSSGNLQLVAGVSAKKVYICSIHLIGAAAYVANIIEGTGAACTTANELAIFGSTTAANGDSFPANGGMTYGSGVGSVGQTATAANGVCLLQSGVVAISGNMTYVQQ